MSVDRSMRHTKAHPCPICGGADGDPRGRERRCFGFTSADGEYTHCSREELAGAIDQGPDQCFAHRMHGPCRCGSTHGEAKSGTTSREEFEATYDYRDPSGRLVFQVVRRPGKRFLQRQPDGAGGWVWNLKGVSRWLYRTPDVLKADPATTVHVVEGEKDADTLWKLGLVATCNPGGAGKWNLVPEDATRILEGRDVVIIADNDDVGREHAKQVRAALQGFAKSVRTFQPPPGAKDATELLEGGGGLNDLVALDEEPKPAPEAKAEEPVVPPWEKLAPALPFAELWTPEPELQLVVPGLGIAPGPVHLVTGSWYTGKTLFLLTMGLCVASGRDFLGVHRVQKGAWTHFDHEMGRRHMKRYLQRLRAGLGVDPEDLEGRMSVRILPQLNLVTPGAVDHYTKLLEGQAFATFDPLRAATPGQKENESEFRQWLDILAVVSDRTKCAIAVLHHAGKPQEGSERRNTGRGSSAIDDAIQTKLVLSSAAKGAPVQVSHEKTRELNNPLEDFWFSFESTPDSVRLVHKNAEQLDASGDDPLDGLKRAILKVVKGKREMHSINEIASRVVGRKVAIQQATKELLDDHRIVLLNGVFRPSQLAPKTGSH